MIRCRRRKLACMARSTCWALPSGLRQRFYRLRPRRFMAILMYIRKPRTIGATSIRSARAPATMKESAAPRPCFSIIGARTVAHQGRADFNTYGPRMHPNDGRVVSNFIVQALLGRDITVYGDGLANPFVLLRRRSYRRPCATHGNDRRRDRPDQYRKSKWNSRLLRTCQLIIEMTGSRSHRYAPSGHTTAKADCSTGQRSTADSPARIKYFEELLTDHGYGRALLK